MQQQQAGNRHRLAGETPGQAALRRNITTTAAETAGAVHAARQAYALAHPRATHPSDQVLAVAVGHHLSLRLKAAPDTPGWTFTAATLRVLGTPSLVVRWLHPYAWRVMMREGSQWRPMGAGILPGPHPAAPPQSPAAPPPSPAPRRRHPRG
jgi:hypothetical protein